MQIVAAKLSVKPRRGQAQPTIEDNTLVLGGESEWLLNAESHSELDAIETALSGFSERLSKSLLLLSFGNAVGFFTVPYLGEIKRIKVVRAKCGPEDFDRMLLELTETASALPFAGHVSGALPYDRFTIGQDAILYYAFVHLRHALSRDAPFHEQLLPAFKIVLSEPHRVFANVRREQHPFLVRRVDAITLQVAARGRYRLMPIPEEARSRLPTTFARLGHLPERVNEGQVETDCDTAENRLVKRVLVDAVWLVAKMREVAQERSADNNLALRLVRECDELEQLLTPVSQAFFWRKVGNMVQVPSNSTVLQRRRGYRVIYQHFVKSRLSARVPMDLDNVRDLLEAKNIAKLYELWSYFVMAKVLTKLLGRPSEVSRPQGDPMQLSVTPGFAIEWSDGTRLTYNQTFSRSKSGDRFSYSVPLRPDLALRVPRGRNAGLHLFDAKFRVEKFPEPSSEPEDDRIAEEIATEERNGTFKQADLYKMHTYRDSIRCARSVWVLYPGSLRRFFGVDGVPTSEIPERFEGVGAVPVVPGATSQDQMYSILRSIITS